MHTVPGKCRDRVASRFDSSDVGGIRTGLHQIETEAKLDHTRRPQTGGHIGAELELQEKR